MNILDSRPISKACVCSALLLALMASGEAVAQGLEEQQHKRGRLWENVRNDGWIGSLGAWDYLVSSPLGLFPGFDGYFHPVGGEENAIDAYANANMHNFRSGCWIVVKGMLVPGTPPDFLPTPAEYEVFLSGLQEDPYGEAAQREPLYNGGERRLARDLEQVHLTLAFPGVSYGDPDYFAYQVYATVLGGGMSSRLFQEVREARGLAYSVYAYAQSYVDGGGVGIYAGTGPAEVAELVPVIAQEMHALTVTANEPEIARARAQLKAGLLMSSGMRQDW